MVNLRKDILSEEERSAGFEPGDPDDDTFSLGTTHYVENIEEIFSTEEKAVDEPPLSEPEDYVAITNVVDIDTPADSTKDIDTAEEPIGATEPEEVLVMDDEFKDIVKDLLNKDKSKREVLAKISGTAESSQATEDNFNPDENLKDADSLFLDEIAKQEEIITETEPQIESVKSEATETPEVETEIIEEKTETIITETIPSAEKEDEKKKKFPLWLVGSIAAAVLIISVTVIYFVFLTPPKKADILDSDTIKTGLFSRAEEKSEAPKPETEAVADTSVEAETDKVAEVEPEKPVVTEPPLPKPTAKVEAKPESIAEAKPKPPTQPRVTKPTESRKTEPVKPVKVAEPDIRSPVVIEKKEESLATIIPEKKPETKDVLERDITKQEFAVQIYSSPSKEDAERWLEKLRAKNINDAYITEQKIRDVMWYRVRFGKFETREEARAAALRYGFAQTWIDRVR